jgi:hypothetical protein
VPWVAVARAVVESNEREEHARLVRTMRLYDRVRVAAIDRRSGAQLLELRCACCSPATTSP